MKTKTPSLNTVVYTSKAAFAIQGIESAIREFEGIEAGVTSETAKLRAKAKGFEKYASSEATGITQVSRALDALKDALRNAEAFVLIRKEGNL